MMGGHDAESQNFRASEAAIRLAFWKKYRTLNRRLSLECVTPAHAGSRAPAGNLARPLACPPFAGIDGKL